MKFKTAVLFNVIALAIVCCHGCGPKLEPEDLGTVVFELPRVPGADRAYPLPESKQRSADPREELRPPDSR